MLVIGLGNPGAKYAHTRHNVGQMVIDELAARSGETLSSHRAGALVASARLGYLPSGLPGPKMQIAKLTCYMNVSGGPTKALANYFGVPPTELLIVHDDLDLPVGTLRLKQGGGEGGHNGLKSISQSLGTKNYLRLRIGVGRPPGRQDPAEFVLANLSGKALTEIQVDVARAADVIEKILTSSFRAAQQDLHAAK
ncbi:MAG: aminoacyl-tRNA hydrolase [Actinomycetaceae bacterium]|nr:aminoacyl-tRNA hydrolase [Actinomycetaceae bacterium]